MRWGRSERLYPEQLDKTREPKPDPSLHPSAPPAGRPLQTELRSLAAQTLSQGTGGAGMWEQQRRAGGAKCRGPGSSSTAGASCPLPDGQVSGQRHSLEEQADCNLRLTTLVQNKDWDCSFLKPNQPKKHQKELGHMAPSHWPF